LKPLHLVREVEMFNGEVQSGEIKPSSVFLWEWNFTPLQFLGNNYFWVNSTKTIPFWEKLFSMLTWNEPYLFIHI
jgi:hypothetical protein